MLGSRTEENIAKEVEKEIVEFLRNSVETEVGSKKTTVALLVHSVSGLIKMMMMMIVC